MESVVADTLNSGPSLQEESSADAGSTQTDDSNATGSTGDKSVDAVMGLLGDLDSQTPTDAAETLELVLEQLEGVLAQPATAP